MSSSPKTYVMCDMRILSASVLGNVRLERSQASLIEEADRSKVAEKFAEISNRCGCDIAFQPDDVDRFMRRMIVFDMDSTLIQQEVGLRGSP